MLAKNSACHIRAYHPVALTFIGNSFYVMLSSYKQDYAEKIQPKQRPQLRIAGICVFSNVAVPPLLTTQRCGFIQINCIPYFTPLVAAQNHAQGNLHSPSPVNLCELSTENGKFGTVDRYPEFNGVQYPCVSHPFIPNDQIHLKCNSRFANSPLSSFHSDREVLQTYLNITALMCSTAHLYCVWMTDFHWYLKITLA